MTPVPTNVHLLDVVGRARHELAGLRAVVIAEAQTLDLGEERLAQVVGHSLRRALGQVALQEGEQPAHERKNYQAGGGLGQHRRLRPRVADVDCDADQLGRGETRRGDNQQGHDRTDGLPTVPV